MEVRFGSFLVNIAPSVQKVLKTRMVPGTKLEEVKTVKMVEKMTTKEVVIGCTASCAGLRAYTKTSLRRAIKEGDLSSSGACFTCGLLGLVGAGRARVEVVPHVEWVQELVTETRQVPCLVEEQYYEEIETVTTTHSTLLDIPAKESKMNVSPVVVEKEKYVPPHARLNSIIARAMVAESERKTEDIFNFFFNKPAIREALGRKKYGKVVKTVKGHFIKPASDEQVQAKLEEIRDANALEEAFFKGQLEDKVTPGFLKIRTLVANGESVGFRTQYYKRSIKKATIRGEVRRYAKQHKPVKGSARAIFDELVSISKKNRMGFEIVKKNGKTLKTGFKTTEGRKMMCVRLPHEEGIKKRREVDPRMFNEEVSAFSVLNAHFKLGNADIKKGYSGVILPQSILKETCRDYNEMVVRGRHEGKLIDARCKVSDFTMHKMIHYSSFEREFWKGWKRAFDGLAPDTQHACSSDINNEACGEIVATLFQCVHPCVKVSCTHCRENLERMGREEYFEELQKLIPKRESVLRPYLEKYGSLESVLNHFRRTSVYNENLTSLNEITRIAQGSKSTQMQHILEIQKTLLKSSAASANDLSNAADKLLELTRWFKNHLSQVSKGDVSVFRNKATSKASINFSLLCDNQCDKNGNFLWGERGYHSKRLFSNFFEIIEPGGGYAKYVERINPNGKRNLAIGHLIVPLNLTRARKALEGVPAKRFPVSDMCISKDPTFVHTCCCVTDDLGNPALSTLKSPTKSHLVIGNTGDPKYVDLPNLDENKMYIAKEGYCYLNIFLAMLVNVNESSAKDFTKTVRDTIIPMLGTWPTMHDLATACYILTVFHPETRSAELPRILVDHESKIMHVIDSYGSLDVGFHILKAGTVQQLLPFASESLEGEMKFYRVGGTHQDNKRISMEVALIRSVYRPKELIRIIEDEPYILFLSLVSPKIINALYNVGGLDIALSHWVTRDTDICAAITMLSFLAQRISRASVVLEQIHYINESARQICSLMENMQDLKADATVVRQFLECISNRVVMDSQLQANGFVTINEKLYETWEKIYAQRLHKEWQELGWLEKFSLIKHCYKRKKFSSDVLPRESGGEVEAKYVISFNWCYGKIKAAHNGTRKFIGQQVERGVSTIKQMVVNNTVGILQYCLNDIVYLVNVLLVVNLLGQVIDFVKKHVRENKELRQKALNDNFNRKAQELSSVYNLYTQVHGTPTEEEFMQHLESSNERLHKFYMESIYNKVRLQNKTYIERNFEKIIAFMALLTMMFDEKKSDAVFKCLGKIKTVFGTMDDVVRLQSLDEIISLDDEKKETVDFVLNTDLLATSNINDRRFEEWWQIQLDQNRVVPHYRNTGVFLEFTRNTVVQTCNEIQSAKEQEFLIRGAVGSGKSTGMPHQLSKKGRVLIIEPTRPLAENVTKQLRKEPFYNNATLRMRGLSTFGSSNITVMTSGFALHYYAHNQEQLSKIDYVMIDECHVVDANAMAFYCLLKEYDFGGKILKVSATPPGRECEFTTQYPVKLRIEEQASLQAFSQAQGTGSNMDVTKDGDNILVYVASYNEVDTLSKQLLEKGFLVTKVDGRTMKLGNVEVITKGTESHKHFIVATNIIENGVTLDIDVVVDFGVKVQAELDSNLRSMTYTKVAISYGERIQRLGRVGRVKAGTGLRIGETQKGMSEIPVSVATEAAFLCFAYGLPVMTHNVTTSLLSKCTVNQARTMLHFELPCFFMVDLVSYNGTMHPVIHENLKRFKIRDSEVVLSSLAIPNACIARWISARDYKKYGVRINVDDATKMPFYSNNIPEQLIEQIWKTVQENKHEAGFGRLTLANACKVAYTLTTEPAAPSKTLGIIDQLIMEEQRKKAHFETSISSLNTHSFSLQGIVNRVKNRYLQDHTSHNIATLQLARSQILEFSTATHDLSKPDTMIPYGVLDVVRLQSKEEVVEKLGLKGKWNKSLATNDLLIAGMTAIGGLWMLWDYFKSETSDIVVHQAKRKNQKLKFRDARDKKMGREVYGDDGVIEHVFGEAYTKRGRVKGNNKTKGMGHKTRNFVHLYGFDPSEYTFVRFLDPITGVTIDEAPMVDIPLVQDECTEARQKAMEDNDDILDFIKNKPGIKAYFVNQKTGKALKVDLQPHNPLLICRNSATIAGFPERERELRQTGPAEQISIEDVPKPSDVVKLEGKSLMRGPRDYNPVARAICKVKNISDGASLSLFAIGYGSVLIAPGHLFSKNNGSLEVNTSLGLFTIPNTTQLKIHHLKGRDMVLVQLPKDFPPFPRKLRFRHPIENEKCCLVESLFQQKSLSSCVSETTSVMPTEGCFYWKHWISTKDGNCGSPLVSTKDGFIVGIHGLEGKMSEKNYFVTFPDDFETSVLSSIDSIEWTKHWKYNTDKILWGKLSYACDETDAAFKMAKIARDLNMNDNDIVLEQGSHDKWVFDSLGENLKAVGEAESQLVTKHVVKGKCELFQSYLNENAEAREFFKPFLSHYGPSKLNREAFKKDFFKYKSAIVAGSVKIPQFESALREVIMLLLELDFGECAFVTDPDEILDSLNMKASVGALYKGKKKEYFESMTALEKEHLIQSSCERLFNGSMGVWNGSLKAELRPIEKLKENKTRTFTAAPIDTLLGAKVCVDDFNNRFYELNLKGPWTVGMTKFYRGWDKLLQSLPDGWIYCHADGSRFDSSLTPYLINAIVHIRQFFMEDWWVGHHMLENLYTEVVYTPILTPDGTVVKKFKGNNSGQPSTVVDNTLMVILAVYYAVGQHLDNYDEFDDIFKFYANGDDLIIAVKPEREEILNNMESSFAELGLSYNFSHRSRSKTDLEFMSHQGMLREGMYIPKLDIERIVSILEWDRSSEISHRAEAICAAMIEAWGYDELLKHIRQFYYWLVTKPEFQHAHKNGSFPYIAETALRKLYTDRDAEESELERYYAAIVEKQEDDDEDVVILQSGEEKDAGVDSKKEKDKQKEPQVGTSSIVMKDRDVDTGSKGQMVPRLKKMGSSMKMPKTKSGIVLDLEHLVKYKPAQEDLSNVRATHKQFENWINVVQQELEIEESQMKVVLNGFMVWCIENGTSPNVNGVWTMMDGDEQVEFPLKPFVENAKPTLRQIMHHFSDAAEAYIEFRNSEKPYMPRYGHIRNLRDASLARYAFDFYEMNSRTPNRAREAHLQMKAAALVNTNTRLFGLDGNVTTSEENTERHVATDVNANMHTLLGVRQM
ncbi:polyprotein [Gomphocarpus mosaic virus]|uniref:Genome polyprotein n=1 Tax=Gomphocarpus mosaic virus TaxID=1972994 RepID=A0A348AZK1_9POTV|nr:polyprotein [Gomphocarpus mosaic virus]BBD33993.1 polyprotein [Gomphocarpus mosaic virus]